MYSLINKHCEDVFSKLAARDDVARYATLRDQLSAEGAKAAADHRFQSRYRLYWGLRRRDRNFREHYFSDLFL